MDNGQKCLGDGVGFGFVHSPFRFLDGIDVHCPLSIVHCLSFSTFIKFVQEKDVPSVVELSAGVLPDVVIDERVGIISELARRFPCSFHQFLPADRDILDVQL